jgi:hypothetical protein
MGIADWLQVISLATVAVALMLNVIQSRHTSKQAVEASRQTGAILASLKHGAYQSFAASQADLRSLFFNDPKMVQWYLASRGYGTRSEEANNRTLYVILRLNSHETTFLSYSAGLLDEDVWSGWLNVIKTDFEVAEFVETWPHAKVFYAQSFATFVDEAILPPTAKATTRRITPTSIGVSSG